VLHLPAIPLRSIKAGELNRSRTKEIQMNKILYFLIGPKGSGKTHIGTYVHENTNIHFLRIEPIWVSLKENENGWQKVIEAIHQCFLENEKVMIENLGAGEDFNNFFSELKSHYQIRIIKVKTDISICFKRVKERNNKNHIPVSDDKVKEYNRIASKVTLNWDLIVDNNGQQSIENIKEKIIKL
jgi:shikimate kinase